MRDSTSQPNEPRDDGVFIRCIAVEKQHMSKVAGGTAEVHVARETKYGVKGDRVNNTRRLELWGAAPHRSEDYRWQS